MPTIRDDMKDRILEDLRMTSKSGEPSTHTTKIKERLQIKDDDKFYLTIKLLERDGYIKTSHGIGSPIDSFVSIKGKGLDYVIGKNDNQLQILKTIYKMAKDQYTRIHEVHAQSGLNIDNGGFLQELEVLEYRGQLKIHRVMSADHNFSIILTLNGISYLKNLD